LWLPLPEAAGAPADVSADYAAGVDLVDGYLVEGNMEEIQDAFGHFAPVPSWEYLCAGIAYCLAGAAQNRLYPNESDDFSLREAQGYLDEAGALLDQNVEIHFIQLLIDLLREDAEAYHQHLEHQPPEPGDHFHSQWVRLLHALRSQPIDMAVAQYHKTLALAQTDNQRRLAEVLGRWIVLRSEGRIPSLQQMEEEAPYGYPWCRR
jgi:hypothetical protein